MKKYFIVLLSFTFSLLYPQEPELTIDDYGFQINDLGIPFLLPYGYQSIKTVKLNNKLYPNKKYSVGFRVTGTKSPKYNSYDYYFWVFPTNFMDKPIREDRGLAKPDAIFAKLEVPVHMNSEKEYISFTVSPDTTYTHITIGLEGQGNRFSTIHEKEFVEVTSVFVAPLSEKDVSNVDRELVNSGEIFTVNEEKVTITLFDHKRIDNDIVTIYLNDNVVIDQLKLKRKKKRFKALLKPGVNTIRLHAGNLGEVSPNTAAVIIKSGDKVIEQILTSDLDQSEYFTIIYNKKIIEN